MNLQPPQITTANRPLVGQHLSIGWWMLLAFLTWGAALEAMHAFKLGMYVDVGRDNTRLFWTLAHALGTALGLVHIAWAYTLFSAPQWRGHTVTITSACLKSASTLLPAACILSGIPFLNGSVATGAVLLTPGLLLLLTALLLTARQLRKS